MSVTFKYIPQPLNSTGEGKVKGQMHSVRTVEQLFKISSPPPKYGIVQVAGVIHFSWWNPHIFVTLEPMK